MAFEKIGSPWLPDTLGPTIDANFEMIEQNYLTAAAATDTFIPKDQIGVVGGLATLAQYGSYLMVGRAWEANVASYYRNISDQMVSIDAVFRQTQQSIADLVSGASVAGKARELDPVDPPDEGSVLAMIGGVLGWHGMGALTPAGAVGPVSFSDTGAWGAAGSDGFRAIEIAHGGKYPLGVYKQDGNIYRLVGVGVGRDDTNIQIRAITPFSGYVLLG